MWKKKNSRPEDELTNLSAENIPDLTASAMRVPLVIPERNLRSLLLLTMKFISGFPGKNAYRLQSRLNGNKFPKKT